jgi:hypothetical protein
MNSAADVITRSAVVERTHHPTMPMLLSLLLLLLLLGCAAVLRL